MLELEAKEWRQQLVLRCNSEFVCFLIGVVYLLFLYGCRVANTSVSFLLQPFGHFSVIWVFLRFCHDLNFKIFFFLSLFTLISV